MRFNLKLGDHVGYAVRTFSVVNTECGTRSVPYLNGKTALLITPVVRSSKVKKGDLAMSAYDLQRTGKALV